MFCAPPHAASGMDANRLIPRNLSLVPILMSDTLTCYVELSHEVRSTLMWTYWDLALSYCQLDTQLPSEAKVSAKFRQQLFYLLFGP